MYYSFVAFVLLRTAIARDQTFSHASSVDALRRDTDCSESDTCNVELLQKHASTKEETSLVATSGKQSSGDYVTVLVFNTYLVEFNLHCGGLFVTPDLQHRSEQISHWFNSLDSDAVPDVLVLNEIFGSVGTDVVRAICSDRWRGNSIFPGRAVSCDRRSHFEVATPVNGQRAIDFELFPSGGVVVLLKKGLQLISYETVSFTEQDTLDAERGFIAVNLKKNGQQYWVIGTHTKCCVGNFQRRMGQLREIRDYADKNIPHGSRVVYAGDMNLYEFTWNISCLGGKFVNEIPPAKAILGGNKSDTTGAIAGDFDKNGFWLELDNSVEYTWDTATNFYVHYIKSNNIPENDQRYDWIFAPGRGDSFQGPDYMRYQYVPVLTSKCFRSNFNGKGSDDLSDHYGVFAQLCFSGPCPAIPTVSGHLGADGRMPGVAPDCEAPERPFLSFLSCILSPVACFMSKVFGIDELPRGCLVRFVYIIGVILGFKAENCDGCEEQTTLSLLGHAVYGH